MWTGGRHRHSASSLYHLSICLSITDRSITYVSITYSRVELSVCPHSVHSVLLVSVLRTCLSFIKCHRQTNSQYEHRLSLMHS